MLRKHGSSLGTMCLLLMATASPALADMDIANQSGCMACHQIDGQAIGPSYKEVAARYRGDAGAVDKLTGKVHDGGVGNWGQIPMPPNAWVGEDNIRMLVKWVLSH